MQIYIFKKRSIHLAVFASVSIGAFHSIPTLAPSQELKLEEVVVTARRRAESLQDVPVAVTAFTAAEISRRGITDITELAQSAPGVRYAARGINGNRFCFVLRDLGYSGRNVGRSWQQS